MLGNEFWEKLYFAYCIKLGRSEDEFFKSSTVKIVRILEMNADGFKEKPKAITVHSMRDFLK